jgi:ABC-2 type transport system permease protein
MRNILTICRRELYAYFVSPVAWVLLAIFAFLSGAFTLVVVRDFVLASMRSQAMGQSVAMSINDYVIAPVLSNIAVISLFVLPLMTMRLFAEEKRQGTIELLITSPVREWEIILGKFFAALLMWACMLVILVIDMSFLFIYGTPDWKPFATGLLGTLLMGASILALGAFISSLTSNQIVAGAIGFTLGLVLWILNWTTSFGEGAFVQFLNQLSIVGHLESFSRGVFDTKDILYYLSMIFFGLFLTARSVESMRWKA